MKKILFPIILICALVVGGATVWGTMALAPHEVACTMEAKLCPDGSAVGRTGPNCEFSECPNANADQSTNTPQVPGVVPTQTTLVGTYICLPHKDPSAPHTLECAFGLKTETGVLYALDFNGLDVDGISIPNVGKKITVHGLLTPIEMLSSDYWKTYDIKGIMKVASVSERR